MNGKCSLRRIPIFQILLRLKASCVFQVIGFISLRTDEKRLQVYNFTPKRNDTTCVLPFQEIGNRKIESIGKLFIRFGMACRM